MLHSMTGYGRVNLNFRVQQLTIEIKTLNSKYFDLNLKIPAFLKHKEFDIRNLLQEKLQRGKIDCSILLEGQENFEAVKINEKLAEEYLSQLRAFCKKQNLVEENLLDQVLKMPQVLESAFSELSENECKEIFEKIEIGIGKLNQHRIQEGRSLKDDLLNSLSNIENAVLEIEKIAPNRRVKKREKLDALLSEVDQNKLDETRLEQELLYYIEKLDINEELSRLKGHCEYFREIIENDNSSKGKKLGFMSQELGREINTLGAKANDTDIQRFVVLMKEDLEKIKEQVNNAL
ncbi:MAG: YicC/YloC family endoribonuclease [Chitinophagales bacterium]